MTTVEPRISDPPPTVLPVSTLPPAIKAADPPSAVDTWLAEHERALSQLRTRVAEVEHAHEVERDLTVPVAIAAAGMFAIPLALCLPWLATAGTGIGSGADADGGRVSGWTLLFTSPADLVATTALYAVAATLLTHAVALIFRSRGAAVVAAVGAALASIATIGLLFSTGHDAQYDAGAGLLVAVIVLLVLSVAWGTIAELRRWTG